MKENPVSSDTIIRPLKAADTKAFLELKRIGLASDPGSFVASLQDDPPDYAERVRGRLGSASVPGGDIILGAFAPGLVGIIAITRDRRLKRRHKADLHGMYLRREYRGRGLGKALLVKALDMAREMEGLEAIELVVATHNREAVVLYERFGFQHAWTEYRALKLPQGYVDPHHMVLETSARSSGAPLIACEQAPTEID